MRRATTLRNVGAVYLVGIVWCIVMMSSAVALVDPIVSASAAFDLGASSVSMLTMSLAMLLATIVAGGLAMLLKRTVAGRTEVAHRV